MLLGPAGDGELLRPRHLEVLVGEDGYTDEVISPIRAG